MPVPGSARQLEFVDVSRAFGKRGEARFVALRSVDLAVEVGEFVCIIGPSGCGKSTLLDLAAGLFRPTRGSVEFDGTPVRGINTAVGYVTQRDTLLPWRSVRRNVALPLEVQHRTRRDRRARVDELLAKVGLGEFAHRYPSQLSGGMLKRAGIAQTLAQGPSTLLMDEPFGALDAQLRRQLQQDLVQLWEEEGSTIVFVTHDIDEAMLLGDRVVVFGSNPGRIVHVEPIRFARPRTVEALGADPEYTAIRRRLWALLDPAAADAG